MNAAPRHTLSDLAQRFGLELRGDGKCAIDGVGTLATATATQLGFLANPHYRDPRGEPGRRGDPACR